MLAMFDTALRVAAMITDRLTLPPRELFVRAEEFYATALHETVHSTGSQKRLARESILEAAPFGSETYSSEELIAEMGSAYLCAEAGISNAVLENQAAYLAGWLQKLRDDRRLLIHAAAQAQRAADYILNRSGHEWAARVAFETLLTRMPVIRLAAGKNDFAHTPSFILRGLKELHLEFEAS